VIAPAKSNIASVSVDPDPDLPVIDRRYSPNEFAFGMLELTVYRTRCAEFEAYRERRDSHIA
jgi:hypothetical protein